MILNTGKLLYMAEVGSDWLCQQSKVAAMKFEQVPTFNSLLGTCPRCSDLFVFTFICSYKMPAVFGKIEGSGNGIKTAIPNISDVGLSLHRQPGEVNKFFGCELGAQTTYAEATDRAIVNGAHTDATLQNLIHRYIELFVLCPNCRLPETEYKIKNDCIYHRCAACGAKEMVDMSHKLCNYILAQDKKAKKEAKSKGKKDKGKDKKKGKGKDDSDEDKKKKKDKKKEKKSKKDKKEKSGDDDGDKDYLKEAMFGKKEEEDISSGGDSDSVASEAGVDDEGARSKYANCTLCAYFLHVGRFLTHDENFVSLMQPLLSKELASSSRRILKLLLTRLRRLLLTNKWLLL